MIKNQDIDKGADALLSSGIGRALILRRVEARKIAEIVLEANEDKIA